MLCCSGERYRAIMALLFFFYAADFMVCNLHDCSNASVTGEEELSYGYGGTAKASTNCKFTNYGQKFAAGDVITAYLVCYKNELCMQNKKKILVGSFSCLRGLDTPGTGSGLSGSVGCMSDWCTGGCRLDSQVWQHSFAEIMKYFLQSFSPFP